MQRAAALDWDWCLLPNDVVNASTGSVLKAKARLVPALRAQLGRLFRTLTEAYGADIYVISRGTKGWLQETSQAVFPPGAFKVTERRANGFDLAGTLGEGAPYTLHFISVIGVDVGGVAPDFEGACQKFTAMLPLFRAYGAVLGAGDIPEVEWRAAARAARVEKKALLWVDFELKEGSLRSAEANLLQLRKLGEYLDGAAAWPARSAALKFAGAARLAPEPLRALQRRAGYDPRRALPNEAALVALAASAPHPLRAAPRARKARKGPRVRKAVRK